MKEKTLFFVAKLNLRKIIILRMFFVIVFLALAAYEFLKND